MGLLPSTGGLRKSAWIETSPRCAHVLLFDGCHDRHDHAWAESSSASDIPVTGFLVGAPPPAGGTLISLVLDAWLCCVLPFCFHIFVIAIAVLIIARQHARAYELHLAAIQNKPRIFHRVQGDDS